MYAICITPLTQTMYMIYCILPELSSFNAFHTYVNRKGYLEKRQDQTYHGISYLSYTQIPPVVSSATRLSVIIPATHRTLVWLHYPSEA